jgi:hypothetical protein
MSTRVRNLEKTSKDKADEGNINVWIEHHGLPKKCSNINCKNKTDIVGAHVEKVNSIDKTVCIIPLCRECNGQHGKELDVDSDTKFMDAKYLH